MIDALFISDLHLNPEQPEITQRFEQFIGWAASHCRRLYILGDFFHVWAGDDTLDAWSQHIASLLGQLSAQGIEIYFMPGNRDFLIGPLYAKLTGWTVLADPSLIRCGDQDILLAHGDSFCTQDKSHQRFRKLTRNPLFIRFFLKLPRRLRVKLTHSVRQRSQNQRKMAAIMDVYNPTIGQVAQDYGIKLMIHGHTHKPGLYPHASINRYVLSDWDDRPEILCYDDTKGFYFTHY